MKRFLATSTAFCALALGPPVAVSAAEADQPSDDAQPSAAEGDRDTDILVRGVRPALSLLDDTGSERVYDADRVASYAVSTIGELLEALARENGDEAPAVLVNGRPITSRADIEDFPAEAIAKVEALPPGSAARVGGASGQRIYNIILKNSVRSLALTGNGQFTTEGGWSSWRAEALATLVRGQDRVNLAVRHSSSDVLLESDRDLVPFANFLPFSSPGTIVGLSGGQIDPALSALAGKPVVQAPIGTLTGPVTLAGFVAGANTTAPSQVQNFRSLRSAQRRTEISLAANKQFTPQLSGSLNMRLSDQLEQGPYGLPTGEFLLATGTFGSPFTVPVGIAVEDPSRPLINRTRLRDFSLTAGLLANLGQWQLTTSLAYSRNHRSFTYDRAAAGGLIVLPAGANPFGDALGAAIPVETIITRSPASRREVSVDLAGPVFVLPAGTVRARVGATLASSTLTPRSPFALGSTTTFRRPERTVRVSAIVPLTHREGFLGSLGDSDISVEALATDLGRFGEIDSFATTLNWQPLEWLRLSVLRRHQKRAPEPEQLSGPITVTPNVRYFDPLRNETVSVSTISGGFPGLANEALRTWRLSVDAAPVPGRDVHLTAEYTANRFANQIGYTPPPTVAVVAAFPDRFVRDAAGRLVTVDTRPVNFARQSSRELRLGATGSFPLSDASETPGADVAKPVLQFSLAHTIVLSSTVTIRAGLPSLDLLAGDVAGVGTGRQRNASQASVSLTDRGTGLRLSADRTGRSFLQVGPPSGGNLLTFGTLTRFDIKLFADTARLFPGSAFARGGRIALSVENIASTRQRVSNETGATPFGYQPAYRDPLGRTVTIELRKTF